MSLHDHVRAWIDDDPDPVTRAELEELLTQKNDTELADRFSGFLEFGTAGLRGALGAGPNRMNRVVVGRAAVGLINYLKERGLSRVVIGYDARYNSERFALDTAELVMGAGLEAFLMPRTLPTPVLAYAVNALSAHAGVMVTASHNPPQDNGYKVYLGGVVDGMEYYGSQIVPPADQQIASHIAAVTSLASQPRKTGWKMVEESLIDDYVERTAKLAKGPRNLKIVHTALHGVGTETLIKVFGMAGFIDVHSVEEQRDPDPDFPTVAFPNPEEPGAIDLALAKAKAVNADLVIANDPDADRCAVAINDPELGWRMLRGDEVGFLLGDYIARSGAHDGRDTLACSIVSSSMLGRIAQAYELTFEQTLTGFKWLAKVPGLLFGYEEALGYCVDPETVNDKDGISAALVIACLAAELKAEGKTIFDRLVELAQRHGLHATEQLSLRLKDLSVIPGILKSLVTATPKEIAGFAVEQVEDLSLGSAQLPPTDGVRLTLAGGRRIIVRPSGTEPKIKCYFQTVTSGPYNHARRDAAAELAELKAAVGRLLNVN